MTHDFESKSLDGPPTDFPHCAQNDGATTASTYTAGYPTSDSASSRVSNGADDAALFEGSLQIARDIRKELLEAAPTRDTVTPGQVLAQFIGMSGVPGHFVNAPEMLKSLPSHTDCLPPSYVRNPQGSRSYGERSTGRPINEDRHIDAAATGAYFQFDSEDFKEMRTPEIAFGSVMNPITLAHRIATGTELRGAAPVARANRHQTSGTLAQQPPCPAMAHDAMLHYKVAAGKFLSQALQALPIIGIACTNDYPAVLVGIKDGALRLPKAKARLATVPTAQRQLAELSMYLFMGLSNAWGCNRRNTHHLEMSHRMSFGFPTPSVSFIDSNFRLNIPFAPPQYLQGVHFAVTRLDAVIASLFEPHSSSEMQTSLQRTKHALLTNLGLAEARPDDASVAYYRTPPTKGKTAANSRPLAAEILDTQAAEAKAGEVKSAIENAMTFGDLLTTSFERPRANTVTLTTVAGSLVRAAGPMLAGLVMNHPDKEFRALELAISQIQLRRGKISFIAPRTSAALTRPGSYPTPLSQLSTHALDHLYTVSMQRVSRSLHSGLHAIANEGFEPRALACLEKLTKRLAQMSGQELQRAWDCIEGLMTAGVAYELHHMPQAVALHPGRHEDSDSEIEFEPVSGPNGEMGSETVMSRKITTHNGMQSIILGVVAAAQLLRTDELFIRRPALKSLYYEAALALPNLGKLEHELAPSMAYGAAVRNKTAAAEALDLNLLVENAFQPHAVNSAPLDILADSDKRIWHVDVTSTPQHELAKVLRLFEEKREARVMFMVCSGLKHQQFTATNSYGTVRVFVKGHGPDAHAALDMLMDAMRDRMNPMSVASNALRRAYKTCGLVPTSRGLADARQSLPMMPNERPQRRDNSISPTATEGSYRAKRKAAGNTPPAGPKKLSHDPEDFATHLSSISP